MPNHSIVTCGFTATLHMHINQKPCFLLSFNRLQLLFYHVILELKRDINVDNAQLVYLHLVNMP